MAKVTSKPEKITIDFGNEKVKLMKDLFNMSPLPAKPPMKASSWELGTDYDYLLQLREKFQTWSWDALKSKINRYDHFKAGFDLEGKKFDIHYLYAPSPHKDAIPLLLHGWPGTFNDYNKVIEPLTNPPEGQNRPAFHVITPSLPGFFFSSFPEDGCTLVHTAKVFHALMVEVLGFQKYAVQGGDWGSWTARIMGCIYGEFIPAIHFNMFLAPTPEAKDTTVYTEREKAILEHIENFMQYGRGYFMIQGTKPFTIGMAIGSSPLAILTYITEKFHDWSDPRLLDPNDILDTMALYFLSGSFPTSVLVYQQSGPVTMEMAQIGKWLIKSKIGFTHFPYEGGASPRSHIALTGNVVFYKERDEGGHFPALDVPHLFVDDVREFFKEHWSA